MAMIRMMMAAVMCVAIVACGDAGGSERATHDAGVDAEECTGEHLKLNYRSCMGDEAWQEELNEAGFEAEMANREGRAPDADTNLHGCGDAESVAHYCDFDPEVHDAECRWWPGQYPDGVDPEGEGKPTLYCSCTDAENVTQDQRERCDE